MNGDPLWRRIAYYGVIISFFGLPLVMLAVHLALWDHKETLLGEFRYLADFHKVLAALLFAMLGFNSLDKRLNNGKKE
jgi:hypothetical protein